MVKYKALKGSLKKSVNYRELTLHALANLEYTKSLLKSKVYIAHAPVFNILISSEPYSSQAYACQL